MDLIGTLQFNMVRKANSRGKLRHGGLMKSPAQTAIFIDIFSYIHIFKNTELADALDSGSSVLTDVEVQILSSALTETS